MVELSTRSMRAIRVRYRSRAREGVAAGVIASEGAGGASGAERGWELRSHCWWRVRPAGRVLPHTAHASGPSAAGDSVASNAVLWSGGCVEVRVAGRGEPGPAVLARRAVGLARAGPSTGARVVWTCRTHSAAWVHEAWRSAGECPWTTHLMGLSLVTSIWRPDIWRPVPLQGFSRRAVSMARRASPLPWLLKVKVTLGWRPSARDAVAEKGLLRAPPRMTPGPIWTQSGSRRLRMRRNSSVSARNAFPVGFSLGFFLLATVPSPTAEPDSHHPAKIFA